MFYIVFEPGKRAKISVKIGWRAIAWCRSRIHFAQAWFCYLQSGSEVSLNDLTCFQRDLGYVQRMLVYWTKRPKACGTTVTAVCCNCSPSDTWLKFVPQTDLTLSIGDFHVKNTVKWSIFYTWNCTFESRSAVWNFSLIYLLHLWLEVVS